MKSIKMFRISSISSILLLTVYSCCCIINFAHSIEYAPIVQTDRGQVRGLIVNLTYMSNSQVYLYEGIRYGQAKRFEKPMFADPWDGVYDATRMRHACPQLGRRVEHLTSFEYGENTKTISEDCLFLNVWKPARQPRMLLPVMVWIHGGAFIGGTVFDDSFDSRYMTQMGPVIVVGINYRLGPFGFLYSGDEQAPGNQGLHDQILALKWVQKNIQHFGGDPNRVTVFGESAGAMSVGALLLSPLSKNLFQRAILQSGAPNAYLGSCHKDRALEKTENIATKTGCLKTSTINMTSVMECLRNKTMLELLDACKDDIQDGELMIPIYGDELMPISPVQALKTKQFNPVDVMFGVNRNEGSGFVSQYVPVLDPNVKHPNITIGFVKSFITIEFMVFKQPHVEEIVEFYTKDLNESRVDQLRMAIADSFGDFHLVCPTMLFGEYYARVKSGKSQDPQHYFYSYRLMYPLHHGPFSGKGWQGVVHGEDIAYLFFMQNNRPNYTEAELQLSTDMIKAWTKFAYGGHPSSMPGQIEWKEAIDYSTATTTNSSVQFMALDPRHYRMVEDYFKIKCDQFWKPRIFV